MLHQLLTVRKGEYKAHFITQNEYGSQTAHPITEQPSGILNTTTKNTPLLLYNVNIDPSEKFNIAEQHPEVISEIRKLLEEHQRTIEEVENQLEK